MLIVVVAFACVVFFGGVYAGCEDESSGATCKSFCEKCSDCYGIIEEGDCMYSSEGPQYDLCQYDCEWWYDQADAEDREWLDDQDDPNRMSCEEVDYNF